MNQVRGKGITITNINEIRATKQLVQSYISERYEDSFDKFYIEKNYTILTGADLNTNLSYDHYYRKSYDEFINSKRKLNELGLFADEYSFQSIRKNEQSDYAIGYSLKIRYNK
ncbi:MAG: hypothetical protein Q4G58_18020 [bacterium]|nr:hypothetical protein [bacterium]